MKRQATTGFTLLEMVFALLIFGAMSVVFAAVFFSDPRGQGQSIRGRTLGKTKHSGRLNTRED